MKIIILTPVNLRTFKVSCFSHPRALAGLSLSLKGLCFDALSRYRMAHDTNFFLVFKTNPRYL